MRVEVAFALPERQVLLELEVGEGASVADVIEKSELSRVFPDADFSRMQAGVWGKPVPRDHAVRDGDRVEIYRPLEVDPKEARRLKVGR